MTPGGWVAVIVWAWIVTILAIGLSYDVRRWLRDRRARRFAARMEAWLQLPGAVDRRTPR